MQYNEIGISSSLDWKRIRKLMLIGLSREYLDDWRSACYDAQSTEKSQ